MEMKEYTAKNTDRDIDKQYIMPTHRDLIDAKRYGITMLRYSSYAVYVKKVKAIDKAKLMASSQVQPTQDAIQGLIKEFKYDFLVDVQLKDRVKLSFSDLQFIESIQQVSGLKHICMPERSPDQSPEELEKQIQDWKTRNEGKELVVVSEVYTSYVAEKIAVAKRNGIHMYAVRFRSYKKYMNELEKFITSINAHDMFSVVLGIQPRKWKSTNASMLLPPLKFGAKAISRWIPPRGRKVPMTYLCEDWTYKMADVASKGLMDYNGKSRKELQKSNSVYNSALDRIDTINQASLMVGTVPLLTKVQFKSLFN